MSSSSVTLNAHVPWTKVLSAIGVPTDTMALPAQTRCPLCDGVHLHIHHDSISGGAWHYCFDCKSSGDMIELAAAYWNTDITTAVHKLYAAGLPLSEKYITAEGIARYRKCYVKRRRTIKKLWLRSQEYMLSNESPQISFLREKFRVHTQIPNTRWKIGPGNMIGAFRSLDIEKAFNASGVIDGRCVSPDRVFKGGKWKDVLVVPYHDLPDRICGFLFIGRHGERQDFIFYNPRLATRVAPHHYREAGLACFWAVEHSHNMCGDHIVACGDAMLACRLHLRHFNQANTALPLVAYYDGSRARTVQAWKAIRSKIPVIWGWRMTASLVYQAMLSFGKIAITELISTKRERIDHFVRNADPTVIIKRVIKKAKPWKQAVYEWSERVDDGQLETLITGLSVYGISHEEIATIGPRFANLTSVQNRQREVVVGNRVIVEHDGQWWLATYNTTRTHDRRFDQASLIMNATMRIDRTSENDNQLCYVGRIIHRGVVTKFEIPINRMHNYTIATLTSLVAKSAAGATLYIASGYGSVVVDAAKLFKMQE